MPEFVGLAARRLLLLLLTVLCAALLSTLLVRFAPGFGMDERQLDLRLSERSVAAIRAGAGPPGLLRTLVGLFRGDWGDSVSLNRAVRELMAERSGLTARTLGIGLAIAWAATALLCVTELHVRRPIIDLAVRFTTDTLLCLPAAVVALLALYLDVGPALALAVVLCPKLLSYTRKVLRACACRPHVVSARARGIPALTLVLRHVCFPAAPELLGLAGISVSMAAGAVIPVEALCDSPGVGQLIWQSAMARDLPVLLPATALMAAITCAANLLADAARVTMCRWA